MSEQAKVTQAGGAPVSDRDGLFRHHGKWHFRVKIAGRWKQISTKTASYNDAKKIRHGYVEQQIKGHLPSDMSRWLLPRALDQWITTREHTVAASTTTIYRTAAAHLKAGFGDVTLASITADAITKYQKARLAAKVSNRTLSNRTVNIEVGTLRSVLIRARIWALIAPDVRMLRESASPGIAITREQEDALLAACRASQSRSIYPFVVLAIETGARYNVIRTLQWKRVDFASRCLAWGKDKTPSGTGRVVPLSQRAVAVLEQWAASFPQRQPDHFVFPAEQCGGIGLQWENGIQGSRKAAQFAGPMVYDTDPAEPLGGIKKAWEQARKRAGLKIRFHDLRHLAASRMLDAGVALPKVAKILGWAPSTMAHMAAKYGHFRLDELREAVEAISAPRQPAAKQTPDAAIQ